MFKHILLPTDGSELSERAVKRGIEFAKSINAQVTGFFAIPEYRFPWEPPDTVPPEGYRVHWTDAAKKALEFVAEAAKCEGVLCETIYRSEIEPYEGIIRFAETHGCDLIFMASHGRSGMGALLLGSVTNKVLTHTKIPVLVYR